MTYDGRKLNYTIDVPMTKFYVDGVRQSGNEQDDDGGYSVYFTFKPGNMEKCLKKL